MFPLYALQYNAFEKMFLTLKSTLIMFFRFSVFDFKKYEKIIC